MLYRFDDFVLDPGRRELRRGSDLVAMEPQVFDLLAFLIRTRDRVVSRDDVLAEVWGGRIVSEATLASRISAARSAIGDSGEAQRLIRTIPRKGIRFVGDVREQDDPAKTPTAVTSAPALDSPAIAVLPFTNMSGDPEQDYFADGMVEDIITALSRCSGLAVIARNSSFIYKGRAVDIREVGRELGVGYVLEGSVRRAGARLRISGQLIDAVSGAHLWADRFDGDLTDLFALQDRITESVVAAIEPTLELAEGERRRAAPRPHPDAYDLLLRAASLRDAFTPDSLAAALVCLDQALAIDPICAPAMAASAYCQALRHFQGWSAAGEDYRADAVALAWQASERAPNDAQVLWMAAFAIWNMADDIAPARELFRRSLAINPNSAMALTLSGWIEIMSGHPAEGRAMIERAQRLNPRDPRGWFAAGAMAICAVAESDFDGGIKWAEAALAQNRRFAVALRVLIVALVGSGDVARANEVARRLLMVEPDLTVSGFLSRIPFPVRAMATTYAEALRAAGVPA
ncbi:putative transcriptional regulatory protein, HTH DNA binding domain [Bradyrhizobium oligotrophicum S58]|uniref:Putative transcriptional regulatory protein, HTH DNA binding domain n=1 Tax=Bradyrhizobium oligotrophicum S58 TaxID=1245469 RepID=M4Z1T9_9BRAD|nr:winged helix-turn-helix domain-containing protein [Bradyrhizobium oligotrophicum]BAM87098.1 putative transcriptional regulatory protein, HTH DNA binding domain [Bradyrhizobium oligotrophicum S58]